MKHNALWLGFVLPLYCHGTSIISPGPGVRYSQPFLVPSYHRIDSFIHAFFNPFHTSSNHEERRRETDT
jgi:hypothetical protein